ncbi:unnamed protein product, partial [marine sediment metagenome]
FFYNIIQCFINKYTSFNESIFFKPYIIELVCIFSYFYHTYLENPMKRTKNLKITPSTHIILKKYCEENGLKMFAFVERIIKEKCDPKKDLYGEH